MRRGRAIREVDRPAWVTVLVKVFDLKIHILLVDGLTAEGVGLRAKSLGLLGRHHLAVSALGARGAGVGAGDANASQVELH